MVDVLWITVGVTVLPATVMTKSEMVAMPVAMAPVMYSLRNCDCNRSTTAKEMPSVESSIPLKSKFLVSLKPVDGIVTVYIFAPRSSRLLVGLIVTTVLLMET